MSIQETRAKLRIEVADCMYQPPLDNKNEGWIDGTMQAADEYALVVHVGACEQRRFTEAEPAMASTRCGNDWYCDKAQEIKGLGGSDE